jgi:hypothetical protein
MADTPRDTRTELSGNPDPCPTPRVTPRRIQGRMLGTRPVLTAR